MNRVTRLKLSTGLQLAVTLILGVCAINALSRHILWIGALMFLVIAGSIGRFLYGTRLTPRELPCDTEPRNDSIIPWLLPEI
jgi:hypothetical protein